MLIACSAGKDFKKENTFSTPSVDLSIYLEMLQRKM